MMKSLDTIIINESLQSCLNDKATFPEHVKKISEAYVVKYLVDLAHGTITYYGSSGEEHQAKLPNIFLKMDSIFSKEGVVEAISLVQQGKINYLKFLEKISLAGITSYEVDIANKHVIYSGIMGAKHIEKFPNTTQKE